MITHSPERFFRHALDEMKKGNHYEAAALFREALDLDRERNQKIPEMRYLSYHGLCLARAGLSKTTALQACTLAVSKRRKDPILYLNLGRVYQLAGRPVAAMEALERGLSNVPGNKLLVRELACIDRRSKPALPFLSRDHFLNRYLGQRRANRKRHAAVKFC